MLSAVLTALATRVPELLVCMAGIVLALVNWSRYSSRTPTALALAGALVLIVCIAVPTALVQYVIFSRVEQGLSVADINSRLAVVNVAGALGRTIGLGLVFAAVFAGRR